MSPRGEREVQRLVLSAVTDQGDLDLLGERFPGFQGHRVSTNLTGAERTLLLETFD